MEFIELALGVSPDGGSGWLEWILLLLPVVVLTARLIHRPAQPS